MFVFLLLTSLSLAPVQSEPRVEVLHSTFAHLPSSAVPGESGRDFSHFFRLDVADNGRYALTGQSSDTGRFLIQDGQQLLEQGDQAPWAPGRTVSIPWHMAVNRNGDLAISCETHALNPPTYWSVVSRRSGAWRAEIDESDPFVLDSSYEYDGEPRGISLSDDGTIGYLWQVFKQGVGEIDVAMNGAQSVAIRGVGSPSGQFDGLNRGWGKFYSKDHFYVSANGATTLLVGQFIGSRDYGAMGEEVQVQAEFPAPGSSQSTPVDLITAYGIGGDQSCWFRARAVSRPYWIVRNDSVFAETGDPVAIGSAWTWDLFQGAGSNVHGDWYLFGYANHPTLPGSYLLVINNEIVLLEDDALDFDLDGKFQDDAMTFVSVDSVIGSGMDDQGRVTLGLNVTHELTGESGKLVARVRAGGPVLRSTPMSAGSSTRLTLLRGEAGAQAFVAHSSHGPGPSQFNAGQGEVLLDLAAPWVNFEVQTLDSNGESSWLKYIPATLMGMQLWAQAIVAGPNGLVTSNAISATIQ